LISEATAPAKSAASSVWRQQASLSGSAARPPPAARRDRTPPRVARQHGAPGLRRPADRVRWPAPCAWTGDSRLLAHTLPVGPDLGAW